MKGFPLELAIGAQGQKLEWWATGRGEKFDNIFSHLDKKKNIYFANSKNNYNTNIMYKHRGGFPEGQSPIVLDTLSNAEYNIKYLKNKNKKKTIYNILQEHNNEYSFILPMSLKVFLFIIPNTKSKYSNNTHVKTTRLQCTQIIFKIFF